VGAGAGAGVVAGSVPAGSEAVGSMAVMGGRAACCSSVASSPDPSHELEEVIGVMSSDTCQWLNEYIQSEQANSDDMM